MSKPTLEIHCLSQRRRALAAVLAVFALLATTGTALADDFDGSVSVGQTPICIGQSVVLDRVVPVERTPTGVEFPGGVPMTFLVDSIVQPANATVAITVLDPTVILPQSWAIQPDGTLSSDTMHFEATVTATGVGTGTGIVVWAVEISGEQETFPQPIAEITTVDCSAASPPPSSSGQPIRSSNPAAPATDTERPDHQDPSALPFLVVLAAAGLALLTVTLRRRPGKERA